jgi:transcription elongation factor Elf1
MHSTDKQGGSRPDSTADSYFRCAYCGASKPSTAVEYSALGFPRCPVCETSHGP